ncbi:MAG: hypothetical protein IPM51_10280 [Sphingobacteriaceae bacterium]|nr:hypothetical protein [Sphingobacteriaceae bacterium]
MKKYTNSFICLVLLILLISVREIFSAKTLFIIYTSTLIFYLIIEVALARVRDKTNYLLDPAVLASLFTFILSFGITNYIFINEDSFFGDQLFDRLGTEAFKYLADAMPLVIIGAIAMWVGNHSILGYKLYQLLTSSIINVKKYIRQSLEFNYGLILSLFILSVLARIIAIYLGVFGFTQGDESVNAYSGLEWSLNLIGEAGKLSLLILSLTYFNPTENKRYKLTFIIIFIIELLLGILSGMKANIMLPFLIITFSYYLINKRIKKSYVLFFIAAVFVAYAIVEPFRILKKIDPHFESTPSYILKSFVEAYTLSKEFNLKNPDLSESIFVSALMRSNYVIEIAKVKEYDDKVGLQYDDPDFKYNLFTFPIQAILPRILWSDKPIQSLGNWYTRNVWGWDSESFTAMTPFGFLYFAGGIPYIIIFLFIIGIMQNALFRFIKLGSGGIIIYVGLLSTVVLIDSTVNGIFIYWLRLFPIFLVLQYFIFKNNLPGKS